MKAVGAGYVELGVGNKRMEMHAVSNVAVPFVDPHWRSTRQD